MWTVNTRRSEIKLSNKFDFYQSTLLKLFAKAIYLMKIFWIFLALHTKQNKIFTDIINKMMLNISFYRHETLNTN